MRRKILLLISIISIVLSGCGNDADSLNDGWNYSPSADPVVSVESAIQGEIEKEYCRAITLHSASVSADYTETVIEQYQNYREGWTKDFLTTHMVAVYAVYTADFDGTKTSLRSGKLERIFIMLLNDDTKVWEIWDNTTSSLIS